MVSALLITASCQRSQHGAPSSLEQQASSGNAAAQYLLGEMYDYGSGGVDQDDDEAALWYRKAAEQGYARAQMGLGDVYSRSESPDFTQAAVWYRKAAEQGDARAQHRIGVQYLVGLGTPQDFAEAYFWLDLAAVGEPYAADAKDDAKDRDEAASHLTPADLSREQERARKWLEDHPTKPQ